MQQYQLKQSSSLNFFSIILYCLVLLAIGAFFHRMDLLSALAGLLTMQLLFRELYRYKMLKSLDPTIVTLSDSTSRVGVNQLQFEDFKVFSNRWFVILQMKNEKTSKNMMLVADRFKTIEEYLGFRYQLINLCRKQYVA